MICIKGDIGYFLIRGYEKDKMKISIAVYFDRGVEDGNYTDKSI